MNDVALLPLTQTLAVLFASSLAGLVVMTRGNLLALYRHVWFRRWWTWTLIAAVVLGALALGRQALLALALALAWQGAREAAGLLGLRPVYRRALVLAAPLAVLAVALWPASLPWLPGLFALALVALAVARADLAAPGQVGRALVAFVWVPWLLGHVVHLGLRPDGLAWTLCLALTVALADVGACLVGSRVGGPKLAPTLSPAKTWSGLAGAVVAAYAAFWLLRPVLPAPGGVVWALPLLVALAGTLGDLVESWLKRAAGVKDAGAWLPGFGGLLDRLDSLLLALPVAAWALALAGLLP